MTGLRLLLVSTPIGTLGSGLGGGVEVTVNNVALALRGRGHQVTVMAGAGSVLAGFEVIEVAGEPPAPAQNQHRDAPIVMPPDGLVANFFAEVRRLQHDFDAIVNFAYDWLAFYLTAFLQTPLCHVVGMGSLSTATDLAIAEVASRFPGRLAAHTRVQAASFPVADAFEIIGNGFDLDVYRFNPNPEAALAWVARIAPEKGLEDAAAAAAAAGLPLRVFGVVDDAGYWDEVRGRFAPASIAYQGFLPTDQLQAQLGRCRALLVTPKWEEAFGNVVPEALACGVPVIAYRRGGPAELIDDGATGFLVPPDSVDGLTDAVARLGDVDRVACRAQAERDFSLAALGARMERWLRAAIRG